MQNYFEKNYFENNFARFVHILRHLGINVSILETLTAIRALTYIDILNRNHVKMAMAATMIKNPDQREIFDQAFDTYFAPPEIKRDQEKAWVEKQAETIRLLDEAEEDLAYKGETLDLSEEEKLFYAKLPEEEKKRIREYLAASNLPDDRYSRFKPTLENQVRGSLRYWKQRLGETDDYYPQIFDNQLDDPVMASIINELGEDSSILYEDMRRIGKQDLPKVTILLKKLSRRLATKISRRYRISKKVVKLDLRRSIKANVRYGGVIFKLRYKQKRIQKPKILLICDVSGSMSRYASFVIQFIYGLSAVIKKIESFIFAEELEYVTPFFANKESFEDTMVRLIGKSRIWGKGTNLGAALNTLREQYPLMLTSNTVVIIVSDTKTLEIERAEEELNKLKRLVKDIIWLNTLPQEEWQDLPSVMKFKRYSQMYECYTLAHLEKIVRKQFLH
ncbi:MAG TPA: VWA domain-containing protein [Syntrophomonadaceae bacterium]|nr:VWA domain-containing protein [Syntrophomonadaceae bacterium]